MRLIDADAFAKKAYDVAYPVVHGRNDHERGLTLSGIAELLDDMPVVEAVPADYIREKIRDLDNSIKNYVGRFDHSAAVDAWYHQRGALEGLIAEWEEE